MAIIDEYSKRFIELKNDVINEIITKVINKTLNYNTPVYNCEEQEIYLTSDDVGGANYCRLKEIIADNVDNKITLVIESEYEDDDIIVHILKDVFYSPISLDELICIIDYII